ncbi:MAG: carboxypeptidase-like regulatory domain-containing protein [Bacteroidota bacterium]
MKTSKHSSITEISFMIIVLFTFFFSFSSIHAQESFKQFKGKVVDSNTNRSLEYANLTISGSHIATISNSEGEFILKIPDSLLNRMITVTYLGYYDKVVPITDLKAEKNTISLKESIEKLDEVSVLTAQPEEIIRKVIKNRKSNYWEDPVIMTAFYRESIKKGRKYASLAEAVVDIYKRGYSSVQSKDYVKIYKARKSSNYKRLDTLLIKLQGGPYNNLNIDLLQNEAMLLDEGVFDNYRFSFDKVINLSNRPVYVLNFEPRVQIDIPLFYGKLYIDKQSHALIKADFSLKLDNIEKASKFFVKKKPSKADVFPIIANYQIDFKEDNGKWHYGYSRIELAFKIDWDKKLFNSKYYITIEMASTDWKYNLDKQSVKYKDRFKSHQVLQDKISGFSDPDFWGEYNIIEPEKSIENAIKKIQRSNR